MNKLKSKTVTVFGSSMPLPGEEEYSAAYKLGRLLGKSSFNVCTGGYAGIMEAVSKGAVEEGMEAVGITVDLFRSNPNRFITKEIKCDTLLERIEKLIAAGDAYIVLRGGTGTLVELAMVWEYLNKGLINKKPVAANGELWQNIIGVMENRISFEKRKIGLIKTFNEIEECADYIVRQLQV